MQCRSAFLCAALLMTSACKNDPNGRKSESSYVIGNDDIQPLDADAAKKIDPAVINASVLIVSVFDEKIVKFCSGVMVQGETLDRPQILTNHHCFAEENAEGAITKNVHPDACHKTKVYFGHTIAASNKAVSVPCLEDSLVTDPIADIAKFRLAAPPPESARTLELWTDPIPSEERKAVVVHYPNRHSQMPLTEFEAAAKLPSASLTITDCVVKGPFPEETWDVESELPFALRHTCDLVHGSSGSALVDLETSKILGINWGGIKLEFERDATIDNVATHSHYVQALLEDRLDQYRTTILDRGAGGLNNVGSSANALPAAERYQKKTATGNKTADNKCSTINGQSSHSAPSAGLFLLSLVLLGVLL